MSIPPKALSEEQFQIEVLILLGKIDARLTRMEHKVDHAIERQSNLAYKGWKR